MNTHALPSGADRSESLDNAMAQLGRHARAAARSLALTTASTKNTALRAAAAALRNNLPEILAANAEDVREAVAKKTPSAFLDRLTIDASRGESMAASLEAIAALPDPVGRILAQFNRPNGLTIERVATPLGVIGVIFESRPNVAPDAGALCLKAGNAAILRGGSESFRSIRAIHGCLVEGLRTAGLPEAAISLVPTRDRAAVGAMLAGLNGDIDVIVPRGGKNLVARVQREARVPVFAHLEGLVHIYAHSAADLEKTVKIVHNAKLRRTGVCGAAETLLIDRAFLPRAAAILKDLLDSGCEIRGDADIRMIDSRIAPASEEDWRTEYLDAIISVKVVENIHDAITHIETFGSHHTDAIVTEDAEAAEKFLREVDSAVVLHNASTQFSDGGEFGFGAEIGIATGKMHARGPVGVEQLTSFKYRVRGSGQIRP